MAIHIASNDVYWNYFLALEADLGQISRYVEFCNGNMSTYSLEFSHLLLASASEVDVVAKSLSGKLSPSMSRNGIVDYRVAIKSKIPEICYQKVYISRYGIALNPWENWGHDRSPDWWASYNDVKHHRSEKFDKANLSNVLNSMAGLFLLIIYLMQALGVEYLIPPPGLFSTENNLASSDVTLEGKILSIKKI